MRIFPLFTTPPARRRLRLARGRTHARAIGGDGALHDDAPHATRRVAMAQNRVFVPYDLTAFADDDRRREAAVAAMSRALGRFLSLRCKLYARRGQLRTDVEVGGWAPTGWTESDASIESVLGQRCMACHKRPAFSASVPVCGWCHSTPAALESGKTFVEAMYKGSHPSLCPTAASVREITRLFELQHFVFETMRLCRSLEARAREALAEAVHDRAEGNVSIDDDGLTDPSHPYVAQALYPQQHDALRARELPVRDIGRVGGVGLVLCTHVAGLVRNWLRRIDDLNRTAFAAVATPCRFYADEDVAKMIQYLAALIACRVTNTEQRPGLTFEELAAPALSPTVCEEACEVRFVLARGRAEAAARSDVLAMRDLGALLPGDWRVPQALRLDLLRSVERRAAVAAALRTETMPPELRAKTPSVCAMLDVDRLVDVLTSTSEFASAEERLAAVDAVAGEVLNPVVLREALAAAIHEANTWKQPRTFFLPVVARADSEAAGEVRLPPPPWVHGRPEWAYRRPTSWMRRTRRIGLDPIGLRIVLLASMVMEMLGCCDEPFAPGLLAAESVIEVAGTGYDRARNAFSAVREQLKPHMIGVEYDDDRLTVLRSNVNHLDDDIQQALAPLSHFSIRDLMTCFHHASPLYTAVAHRLATGTREFLTVKPVRDYEAFVHTALPLFLPLVGAFRLRLGVGGVSQTMHEVGDVLRAIPAFRMWVARRVEGDAAPLLLTRGEVREGPPEALEALERWAKRKGLVQLKRPAAGGRPRFVFYTEGLLRALGAAS